MKLIITILLGALAAQSAGATLAQTTHPATHAHRAEAADKPAPADQRQAPLFNDLGNHQHPITTKSPLAQRYFNQGLTLIYGFNHAEAARSFREVARLDPDCAMAYWGVALALGPNINAAMTDEAVPDAYTAIKKALELAPKASEKERAYIEALAKRYAKEPVKDRAPYDAAYADAMREVARRFPDDLDAATLFAEAVMDTMPWAYWTSDGKPRPATVELLETLERVLARKPDHPGALHYYIHAVEASPTPERGLPAADRLGNLVPGAGHLVHMPAHIYIRTGRYYDAITANERAIAADNSYITQCHAQGLYPLAYAPHNHHFLWAAATMLGMSARALDAARHIAAHTDQKMMREPGYGTLQHYWVTPLYTLVRFGRWDEIMKEPKPAADLLYPTGVWHYARGMALARQKRLPEAQQELEKLQGIAADAKLESVTLWDINTTAALLKVAAEALAGETAFERGEPGKAVDHLRRAVELQDGLKYDEPPPFFYAVRQSLGAALLAAGRPAEAERAYREDLKQYPNNGWSLIGLSRSLEAQGKKKEAAEAERQFREAWRHADMKLTASRL